MACRKWEREQEKRQTATAIECQKHLWNVCGFGPQTTQLIHKLWLAFEENTKYLVSLYLSRWTLFTSCLILMYPPKCLCRWLYHNIGQSIYPPNDQYKKAMPFICCVQTLMTMTALAIVIGTVKLPKVKRKKKSYCHFQFLPISPPIAGENEILFSFTSMKHY